MLTTFLLAALLLAYGLLLAVLMIDAAGLRIQIDRLADLVHDCEDDNASARVAALEERWADSDAHCFQIGGDFHVLADALLSASGTARVLGMRYQGDDIADLGDEA